MKVGIVGSRNCGNFHVDTMIKQIPPQCTTIISGGAQGVDTVAQQAAEKLGLPMECYCPDYGKYGKRAPLERNKLIVGRSDLVLAFWDFQSRGTANTIVQCIEQRTEVKVIGLDGKSETLDLNALYSSID